MTTIKNTAVETNEIKTTKRRVAERSPKVLAAEPETKPKKAKSPKALVANQVDHAALTATATESKTYHQRVEIAAYLIAERAGFCGDAAAHWAAAEAEVAAFLG